MFRRNILWVEITKCIMKEASQLNRIVVVQESRRWREQTPGKDIQPGSKTIL